jgi:hypothetical protein
MRTFLFLLSFALIGAAAAQTSTVKNDFKKLKWIVGSWKAIDSKPGITTREQWTSSTAGKLTGSSFSLKGTDTLEIEHLTIIIDGDNIFYVADLPGNSASVKFKMTAINEHGFVCENPDHDFPKMIAYKLEGGRLRATISGNGKSIGYLFERAQ